MSPNTVHARHTAFLSRLALLFVALLWSFSAVAADSAGRLLFTRGNVQIASVGTEARAAKRGDVLHVGDTITTGSASSAQLRMSDGAMIALKAGTAYRIEEQNYDSKAPGKGSQVGELLRGGLRAITGAIGHEKPEAVKYRTPVATIGVRGTVIDVIYIPAEGLPELPGMAPGIYIMVLEGQVLLSSSTGDLLLGPGEIGYVPFIGAPPELRPDLASIFVEFASFEEKDKPKTTGGTGTYSRSILGIQQDTRSISVVLAEQLVGSSPVVSPGPYGIVSYGLDLTRYGQGDFFTSPVTVGASGELVTATGGSGSVSSFSVPAFTNPFGAGSTTVGDSTINWGQYDGVLVNMFDDQSLRIGLTTGEMVNYITATNVIANITDLPTVGSYTYNYVSGSGTGYALNSGSNLKVNFGTATMDVTLRTGLGDYTASSQAISNFYGSGIALTGPFTGGTTSGRFVGSNAEGAVAGFILDVSDQFAAGTAVFAR